MPRVNRYTYDAVINGGSGAGLAQIGNATWLARRIAPPRDTQWELERVRMGAQGGVYLYQTNYNGFGQLVTTNGTMPMAGLWKNRIARETEIVFDGCIPPKMRSYDPQIPVVITQSDFLIFAAHDAYLSTSAVSINLQIDVSEMVLD